MITITIPKWLLIIAVIYYTVIIYPKFIDGLSLFIHDVRGWFL